MKIAAGTTLALTAIALFGSCKGRTTRDVEPNGETVEVIVPEDSVQDNLSGMETLQGDVYDGVVSDRNVEYDSSIAVPLQFQNY